LRSAQLTRAGAAKAEVGKPHPATNIFEELEMQNLGDVLMSAMGKTTRAQVLRAARKSEERGKTQQREDMRKTEGDKAPRTASGIRVIKGAKR
jgi:hypothetical protein